MFRTPVPVSYLPSTESFFTKTHTLLRCTTCCLRDVISASQAAFCFSNSATGPDREGVRCYRTQHGARGYRTEAEQGVRLYRTAAAHGVRDYRTEGEV